MSDWRPHPGPQEDFCSRSEFEVLFGGSAGPGKTDCLIVEATRYVYHPKYTGVIFRRTFPQLQGIIDRTWEYYPRIGGDYRSTEHRWYFPSGAKISLSHMQFEADKYNHQGLQYHFCGFDEVTQFLESQYLYLFSRTRSVEPEIPARIRATTNPGGIGHVWAKARFVDATKPGQTYIDPSTGLSRVFIPARIYDNPTLIDNDPGYLSRLEALPEVEKKRLLYGDWEVFEGQMFQALTKERHGCEPFDIPHDWTRTMCFDWGWSKPWAAAYFADDYEGNRFLYHLEYGCKPDAYDTGVHMIAQDVARFLLKKEHERGENIRTRIADPSIWGTKPNYRRKEAVGATINDDFMGEGVFFLKADNDREQGIHQVHRMIQIEEDIDKTTGEVHNLPQFYAFRNIEHFWRTMGQMRSDPKRPDDVDTTQEDHIYDVFRYYCMFKPVRPKKRDGIPTGSLAAERNRLIRARKYASRHGVSLTVAYSRVR